MLPLKTTERIRALVKARGWSLREFFRRLDMDQSIMKAWENGTSSPDKHLAKIVSILDTSEAYLRGDVDDPSPVIIHDNNASAETHNIRIIAAQHGNISDTKTIEDLQTEAMKKILQTELDERALQDIIRIIDAMGGK